MSFSSGTRLGFYEIISLLGYGGMGQVYRAKDLKLGRDVAIKVLRQELAQDAERLRRFEQEARSASALNHPNIITIYDIGQHEATPYIAMEYVEGKTLRETLAEGPLPTKKLLQLATQIAEGLAKAHSAGIVHRDLKPENLMVTSDGYVKILDFGLAKLRPQPSEKESEAPTITREGAFVGTIGYMSPEQAKAQPTDFRSDQFPLGAILYEMITGKRAFQRDSPVQTLSAIIEQEPESIAAIHPDAPAHLRIIVERCLAKNPGERYDSTRELARELRIIWEELPRPSADKSQRVGQGAVKSIVVLPFVDLRPEPGEEYFADGMTEALITNLAKIKELKVISRTSAMRYRKTDKPLPEIGRELNVNAVVEGSVLRAGNRVRITAQLINAETDQHVWAETFDRDQRDVLSLHSELAKSIAAEIQVQLAPTETEHARWSRRVDPKAYEHYLKGRYYWNLLTEESFRKSIQHFEEAIDSAPRYAEAYAGLADTYTVMSWVGSLPPRECAPRARAAAMKALEIDDALPEAHFSLAYVAFVCDWDWAAAERGFHQTFELNPNYALAHCLYGCYLGAHKRFDESIAVIQRAREIDPFSPLIVGTVGGLYSFARRYEEATQYCLSATELWPDSDYAHYCLGWTYLEQAMYPDAIAELERAVALSDNNPLYLGVLGNAYARAGRAADAQKTLKELKKSKKRYVPSVSMAKVYAGLGEKDEAFIWLDKAYEERSIFLVYLNVDPSLDSLHADPRFQDLLRRMNFPE